MIVILNQSTQHTNPLQEHELKWFIFFQKLKYRIPPPNPCNSHRFMFNERYFCEGQLHIGIAIIIKI